MSQPDDATHARLGLGTAALGRPEYLNLGRELDAELGPGRYHPARLREHAHGLFDAAWAAGVRHLDTARSYGAGEEFVGSWLAAHPGRRAELRIGSKWGYTYVADFSPGAPEHEIKDHGLTTLARQWPETLAALGGPPDLYLVHSLTSDSPVLQDDALLARLRELAAAGVRVGLSTSGPDQGDVLRRAMALPDCPFDTVQATWNVLEPSAGPALAEAHSVGWFVVVKEALANGRLALITSPLADAARDAARDAGVTPDALALAAALAQPWADVVLSGAASIPQLHANLRALDVAAPDVAVTPEEPTQYWASRKAMAWR